MLHVSLCISFVLAISMAGGAAGAQDYVQNHPPDTLAQVARRIFDFTNQNREARGLAPLRWSPALAAAAGRHAERMVEAGYLSHQYPDEADLVERAARAGAHFQSVAENIATGYDAQGLVEGWMHSAPHRRNILDPRMNSLGVGVVERDGTLYAVEDFDEGSAALSAVEVEQRVDELLRVYGIDPSRPVEAASLACRTETGYPRDETGKLIIRFNTGDLNRLPAQVVQWVRSGRFHQASVASCGGASEASGFTTYRVALVFY